MLRLLNTGMLATMAATRTKTIKNACNCARGMVRVVIYTRIFHENISAVYKKGKKPIDENNNLQSNKGFTSYFYRIEKKQKYFHPRAIRIHPSAALS